MKIIYFPLEHIDSRYTSHLDCDIVDYFESENLEYIRIYPEISSPGLKPGMFLDSNFTTKFKCQQLSCLSDMYQAGLIETDDVLFFSDLWFPGIESIPYMNHFNQVFPKIRGILHAGSFTDTDEVRNLERWAKNFEDIVFDITDQVFVGSNFIKNDVCKKRIINPNKVTVTRFPLDSNLSKFQSLQKESIVIFNGRNHPEKQPHLFVELKNKLQHKFPQTQFIWTQEQNLSKDEYYSLLGRSEIVVSFALQENFGFGVLEAVNLGCIPIVPNSVVYPEFINDEFLYKSFDECIDLVEKYLTEGSTNLIIKNNSIFNSQNIFKEWFN